MIVVADASVLVGELLRQRGRELLLHPNLRVLVAEHQWEETEHELSGRLEILVARGIFTAAQREALEQSVRGLIDVRRENRRALVFLDELQRVVTYEDAEQTLRDLIDIYGGSAEAVVLVDGSAERALDGMFGEPVHFGKLVDRLELALSIPADSWRGPLADRFDRAGLAISPEVLDQLLQWSECRPYATMAAARYTALNARKTGSVDVDDFDLQMGLDEARRHLEDDGA
jgi:hypothetical protein